MSRNRSNLLTKTREMSLLKVKQDMEKPEPVKDPSGNTSTVTLNSLTHSKIIISNDLVAQLLQFNDRYGQTVGLQSWDDIIKKLLRVIDSRSRRKKDY